VKSSEIATLFPGTKWITWNGRPQGWQTGTRPAIWLTWSPHSMLPQPVITVWAVPSEFREQIRGWIRDVVSPSAALWLSSLDAQPDTWRYSEQSKAWQWTEPELASG
jgi:hypothetical protein